MLWGFSGPAQVLPHRKAGFAFSAVLSLFLFSLSLSYRKFFPNKGTFIHYYSEWDNQCQTQVAENIKKLWQLPFFIPNYLISLFIYSCSKPVTVAHGGGTYCFSGSSSLAPSFISH